MKLEIDIPYYMFEQIKRENTIKSFLHRIDFAVRNGVEKPHGKWIDESKDALKCSVCGKWVYKPFIGGFPTERTQHYAPNYCAFCGASMVKEGDENG